MGQYHHAVNLHRKEYINPHDIGLGLKLWEQVSERMALVLCALLACSNGRGGGDLPDDADVVGRWSGDPIAFVGDYADDDDLAEEAHAGSVYSQCNEDGEYTDITPMLVAYIERCEHGVFCGTGWKNFVREGSEVEKWADPPGSGVKVRGVATVASREAGLVIDWRDGTRTTLSPDHLDQAPYLMGV